MLYLSTLLSFCTFFSIVPVKLGNNKNDVIIILNILCVCCPLSRTFKSIILLKYQYQQCIKGSALQRNSLMHLYILQTQSNEIKPGTTTVN